jgi:hypothetical protein
LEARLPSAIFHGFQNLKASTDGDRVSRVVEWVTTGCDRRVFTFSHLQNIN